MKKLIFLLLAILPLVAFSQKTKNKSGETTSNPGSQKAKIEFGETTYNFGTISETGGQATTEFKFKNTGSVPLILNNVQAGCGCTTPEWNRQPIAPGESGTIKVSYNPSGRPGVFSKTVTVNSNAENKITSLTIRGNVSRKPADPFQAYKYTVADVKIMTNNVYLGAITNTQEPEKDIEIINAGDQPVTISVTSPVKYITATVTPTTLQKGEKGNIHIKYFAGQKNDWGFVSDKINVKVNDKESGEIVVSATINEDFSKYTSETFETAPVINFSEKETTLDNVAKNTTKTHEFEIENTGKSELIIRKLKPSDESVSVSTAKSTIKPGKKTKVTVTLKTDNNAGKKIKLIQFTTNDPQNPITTYKITTQVQ